MRDRGLWARLQAFRFDAAEGSALFPVKLARAQGWSRADTLRVIEEYRRFGYLTQVADGEVTPSTGIAASPAGPAGATAAAALSVGAVVPARAVTDPAARMPMARARAVMAAAMPGAEAAAVAEGTG